MEIAKTITAIKQYGQIYLTIFTGILLICLILFSTFTMQNATMTKLCDTKQQKCTAMLKYYIRKYVFWSFFQC